MQEQCSLLNPIQFYFDNVKDTSLLDSKTLTSPFAVALRSSDIQIIELFLEYYIKRDIDQSDVIAKLFMTP